ncbi:YcjF family protein [Actibacterium pelagium]|uniref:TIGR01620 family protein n=1 Tax=Actibacterium pelagium TaxID=2029103 RepID=A0A917ALF7_9RHOB|nr:TIGR01620 family protein [Actibacterium pelagium]GGE60500.1 TIGR01620 family protein [Actibacterium pelagium]
MTKGPIVIDLDSEAKETPATAPPVPEVQGDIPQGQAMKALAQAASRPRSPWAKWFWGAVTGLLGLILSVAIWDFVTGLLTRNSVLGGVALALAGVVLLGLVLFGIRELAGFARLRRMDGLRKSAEQALAENDLAQAHRVKDRLLQTYSARPDTSWGRARLAEREADAFDADTLLGLFEVEVLSPLDQAAQAEVQAAARQVATITALVPLALADLISALVANLRMIRRIAEIYGGRSGVIGNWRLTRSVLTHLVATGALAVGDDMLEPLIGGGLLGKLSRRFGEGMVNGALTARVGVAAIEVCRPLPFVTTKKPSVRKTIQKALSGLFKSES